MYVRTYVCMYVCARACVRVCVCMYVCARMLVEETEHRRDMATEMNHQPASSVVVMQK
jgi:hypothetical protein